MSTARFQLALWCICTSALAGEGDSTAPAAEELELALARTPAVYVVVDLDEPSSLAVKARGMALDSAPIAGWVVLVDRPVAGRAAIDPLALPTVVRVVRSPDPTWRRLVAPPTLSPYVPGAEPPPAAPTPAASQGDMVPSAYLVGLDNGWELEVCPRLGRSLVTRLEEALASGWARVRGRPRELGPPRLELVLAPDDARRLLHLFRPDLPLLLVGGGDPAPAADGAGMPIGSRGGSSGGSPG